MQAHTGASEQVGPLRGESSTLGRFAAGVRRLLSRLRSQGSSEQPSPDTPEAGVKAADYWDRVVGQIGDTPSFPGHWTAHPVVRAAVMRRISGRADLEWIEWVKERFLPNGVERGLSIGCSGGYSDRTAVTVGLCRAMDCLDVSPGAVALAEKRAREAGLSQLSYRVADMNSGQLAAEAYDLVLFAQSLHHIDALEHALDQVRRTLRPRGWVVLNEYIGPSRLRWTNEQLAVVNELLALLPERLRRLDGPGGEVRLRMGRVPLRAFAIGDPSEAVRSAEIVPLVSERFEVVERRDFGGTVLYPLLYRITGNFDPANETENAILRLLVAFEDLLLARRILPSDFTLIVARRPD